VDAGSSDDSHDLLVEALGAENVVRLEPTSRPHGFGEAVAAGLRLASDQTTWVWLLHDDSAPDRHCLAALIEAAEAAPRAGILGPKALGWNDRRLLVEVGFTVTGSGRRFTDLDTLEHDQGQHDGRDVVHAVGTAGMFLRRDVIENLDGFDPALPLYRDDLDLCWRAWRADVEVQVVPDAIIHHREASTHGRREGSTRAGQGHRLDRRSAIHVLLAQTPALLLPFTALRLAFGSLIVAIVAVLGKDPRRAADEALAWGSMLAHPGRLFASRRRIAATSVRSSRAAVKEFRPGAAVQARQAAEALSALIGSSRSGREPSTAVSIETGPTDDSMDLYDDVTGSWLRHALTRPGVVLTFGLLVIAVIATRTLWFGDGVLIGGALLPVPSGAGDLWSGYAQAWHDVGPGSTVPAPPWLALLAAFSGLLLGKVPWAIGALLLVAVPLAGLSAWWSLRGVIGSVSVRMWASIAYAVLPGMTAAIATGRIGTTAAVILAPPTARALIRTLAGPDRPIPGLAPCRTRTPWWTALLLAALTSVMPVLWPVVFVVSLLAVLVLAIRGSRRGRALLTTLARLAIATLVPLLLLAPWSLLLILEPNRLLLEPGLPVAGVGDPGPVSLLLLNPGGPGSPPVWVGAGVLAGGLVALLRRERRIAIVTGVCVAGAGLLAAIVVTHLRVPDPATALSIVPWAGALSVLTAGGLITSAALAADGLRQRMSGQAFGWRQPVSGIAAVVAIAAVAATAVLWLPGAGDPLRRGTPDVLPPFVAAEALGPQAPRTLVVRPNDAGGVSYALVNGDGPELGDPDVGPGAEAWQPLDTLVSALVSGRGGAEVEGLADYAVRYIVAEVATNDPLVRNLDSVPGLRRVAGEDGEVLWRVGGVTARVRALPTETTAAGSEVVPLPVRDVVSAQPFVDSPVPGPGEIRLAQDADAPWRAVLADGRELARSPVPTGVEGVGLARFVLPVSVTAGDRVLIDIDSSSRTTWLWIQGIAVLIVIILALPASRRSGRPDTADDAIDPDVPIADVDALDPDAMVDPMPTAGGDDERA